MSPNHIETAGPVEAKKVDTTEVRKVSFWVTQIFVLAATIAGVYLAANQGFRQAIAYEKLMGDKSNYYLRLSLKEELRDNLSHVRIYIEKLKTGGLPARKAPFQLDTFVWESMKFSSATLETPSILLAESRAFYRTVADIQRKISDSSISVENGIKQLDALIAHMENEVLPRFDADLANLKAILEKNSIQL